MRARASAAYAAQVMVLVTVLVAGCTSPPAAQVEPGGREPGQREPKGAPRAGDPSPQPIAAAPLAPALEGAPLRPRSVRQAARQLVAADRALAEPGTPSAVLAAAGHTQQLAVRALADRPEWDRRLRDLLPRPVLLDTVANVEARRTFRSMFPDDPRDLADELPAWRVAAPRPAAELRGYYRTAERRYGVDWEYLAAINLVETAFGRIRATSVAGAQGPMQFIPTTWDIYGEGGDITDPRDAILAAGRLLSANGFAEDRAGALYRYNNSEAYVRGVTVHARVMQRTPHAYRGYHQWPVYYLTRQGAVWLPEGYDEQRPVPVREYLARRR